MNKNGIDALTLQIKKILSNQPILPEDRCEEPELADLQDGIAYLSQCLTESNGFLRKLAAGTLDVQPPGRHNLMAGSLKELQSGLLHLSWQAQQVAHGDYHQRVNFLGSFSESFNMMTEQLEERESHLKNRADDLEKSRQLLISILNVVKNLVVVAELKTGKVIYANHNDRPCYDFVTDTSTCGYDCVLAEWLRAYNDTQDHHYEYDCPVNGKLLSVDSFPIIWGGTAAYVHIITDITKSREKEERLESMAYLDELTGLYNRRYCLNYLSELLQGDRLFCICFLDLDRLKYVNDNFGHRSGDDYLTSVTKQLTLTTRITDVVCRIGGDEFVLLLPDCDEAHALPKMEDINRRVKGLNKDYPTSVSYGILFVEQPKTILSPEALLQQADKKMYTFKRAHMGELPPGREAF